MERLERGMEERMANMTAEIMANLTANMTAMFTQFVAGNNNVAQDASPSAIPLVQHVPPPLPQLRYAWYLQP